MKEKMKEIALRVKELRELSNISAQDMQIIYRFLRIITGVRKGKYGLTSQYSVRNSTKTI